MCQDPIGKAVMDMIEGPHSGVDDIIDGPYGDHSLLGISPTG